MRNPPPNLIDIRISRDAIVHNLNTFKDAQGLPIAPVLKSNAYGHGIAEVGKIVEKESVPFACVNSLAEAYALREAGVTMPLLVIGYTSLDHVRECGLENIAFGVISLDGLKPLQEISKPLTIHLEIDTGMRRHGVMPEEIEQAIEIMKANPMLRLDGVYSHLADGDTKDSALNARQIETWNAAAKVFREKCPRVRYLHLSATTGVAYAGKIDANLARLGVGLYGMNASLAPLVLRPALGMRTRITSFRTVKKGEAVGYNGTYVAPLDRKVATVPIGYNEGIDRRLSGKGSMLVRGKTCPILGRVSMNITSLDVTNVVGVSLDDEVIAISANPSDPNSIDNIAKLCDSISYEIMVHIPSELPRMVV